MNKLVFEGKEYWLIKIDAPYFVLHGGPLIGFENLRQNGGAYQYRAIGIEDQYYGLKPIPENINY